MGADFIRDKLAPDFIRDKFAPDLSGDNVKVEDFAARYPGAAIGYTWIGAELLLCLP